jgi:hypothetical protein
MKKSFFFLFFFLIFSTSYSQDTQFELRNIFKIPVNSNQLKQAKTLADLNPGFAKSWISSFVSVTLSANCDGVPTNTIGLNDILTNEQLNMLKRADIGSNIDVIVLYKKIYTQTYDELTRSMNFTLSLIPEQQAEFDGGKQVMNQYFNQTVMEKIATLNIKELPTRLVKFTIDETGEVKNAKISQLVAEPVIDQIIMEALNNMPKWKPAQSVKGKAIKQNFELVVFNRGC